MSQALRPRIGAHTPTSGGMAKRSIEYARITEAEAIQVFTSNPRGWAMPETNHEADALFRERARRQKELTRTLWHQLSTHSSAVKRSAH